MRNIFIPFIMLTFLLAEYNATKVADDLNLSYTDYNFLMGFTGASVGIIIFATAIYLVTR